MSPLEVVKSVFVGMETNNGSLIEEAFLPEASMYTIVKDSLGYNTLRAGNLKRFVDAVNSPKDSNWSEPIWNEKIEVEDGLASIWVDYAFYLGDNFHHCGVDAFHLILSENGWKIFHLVDTREVKNCKIPTWIQAKYEN